MSGPYDDHARSKINSRTQPNARFWMSYRDLRGTGNLGIGEYNLLTGSPGGVNGNDIDVMYVPPNWNVRGTTVRHYGPSADFDGSGSQNTGATGVYWNFNLNNVGINDIDHLWITQKNDTDETNTSATVPYTWDRFKLKCCAGANEEGKCGIHVMGKSGNDCDEAVGTCTGADLKNTYGTKPPYKTQYCTKYARAHDNVSDLIKKTWCNNNPDDSWCGCMNLTETDGYKKWQKLMTKKYPEIPVSVLMYGDEHGANPCRDKIDYDMESIFIPSSVLASKGQLPKSYNITNLEVTGSNNVLSNVSMSQNVTNNTGVAAVENGATSLLSSITKSAEDFGSKYGLSPSTSNMILLIIVVALFGTAGYYMFIDDDKPPMQQYQQPYPQQYPQPVR